MELLEQSLMPSSLVLGEKKGILLFYPLPPVSRRCYLFSCDFCK